MSGDHEARHSEIYFGPERDHWWNRDHLALLGRRWGLESVRSMLDVGSGQGHWGTSLLGLLADGATLEGVDREPDWVQMATERAAAAGIAGRCRYRVADAAELPFDDDTFDLVTCQTVLIHLADPLAVVREMVRVARPGGLVLASEPNNRAHLIVDDTVRAGMPIEARLAEARFFLTCEQGKIALGEGDNSLGDVLPAIFARAGLTEISASLSDKAALVLPPYESEEQEALAGAYREEAAEGRWGWEREQARRYFLAGGGSEEGFEREWPERVAASERAARAIDEGRLASAGGGLLYAIAGRKATAT